MDDVAFDKMFSSEDLGRITHMQHGRQIMTAMTKIEKLLEIPLTYFSEIATSAKKNHSPVSFLQRAIESDRFNNVLLLSEL